MKELDDNVFIQRWNVKETVGFYIEYFICYIDGSMSKAAFAKESTSEEVKTQLLYLIDKDLKEKGWVKEERVRITMESMASSDIIGFNLPIDNEEPKYNPAEDPYYKNEDLYIPNDINCIS